MAYGYWKTGRAEKEAVFHLFFRRNPFSGGYTVAAGLQYVLDYLDDFRFSEDDVEYLAGLTGNDGNPLFDSSYGLTVGSPCIDTADDTYAPTNDIAGNPRVDVGGVGISGTLADMGAYETVE